MSHRIPDPERMAEAHGVELSGSAMGAGAAHALVAESWAPADKRRMAELDYSIKVLGRCRYCGRTLTDRSLERHPGVCGWSHCRAKARRR